MPSPAARTMACNGPLTVMPHTLPHRHGALTRSARLGLTRAGGSVVAVRHRVVLGPGDRHARHAGGPRRRLCAPSATGRSIGRSRATSSAGPTSSSGRSSPATASTCGGGSSTSSWPRRVPGSVDTPSASRGPAAPETGRRRARRLQPLPRRTPGERASRSAGRRVLTALAPLAATSSFVTEGVRP